MCSRALLDRRSLAACLALARASAPGEVPIGALVRCNATHRVLAAAANGTARGGALAHAEVRALAAALRAAPRLDHCTLYVTLEPCLMCLGAAVAARVARVVFAARSAKYGAFTSGGLALEAGGSGGSGGSGGEGSGAPLCAACSAAPPAAWLRASPVRMQVACGEDVPLLQGAAAESAALLAAFFAGLRRGKLGAAAPQLREAPGACAQGGA
jgi:tRNA(Arg) A34 adenosine deaminase TadA